MVRDMHSVSWPPWLAAFLVALCFFLVGAVSSILALGFFEMCSRCCEWGILLLSNSILILSPTFPWLIVYCLSWNPHSPFRHRFQWVFEYLSSPLSQPIPFPISLKSLADSNDLEWVRLDSAVTLRKAMKLVTFPGLVIIFSLLRLALFFSDVKMTLHDLKKVT